MSRPSNRSVLRIACLFFSLIAEFYLFIYLWYMPKLPIAIIGRKRSPHAPQLPLPPVIRALGLLEHLDPVPLFENEIPFALSGKVVEGGDEESRGPIGRSGRRWRGLLLLLRDDRRYARAGGCYR